MILCSCGSQPQRGFHPQTLITLLGYRYTGLQSTDGLTPLLSLFLLFARQNPNRYLTQFYVCSTTWAEHGCKENTQPWWFMPLEIHHHKCWLGPWYCGVKPHFPGPVTLPVSTLTQFFPLLNLLHLLPFHTLGDHLLYAFLYKATICRENTWSSQQRMFCPTHLWVHNTLPSLLLGRDGWNCPCPKAKLFICALNLIASFSHRDCLNSLEMGP